MFSENQINNEVETTVSAELNVNKVASVCALFAPISIVLTTIITVFTNLPTNILLNRMGISPAPYYFWSQFGSFITAILSLGIYIGAYLIFVKRYLSKLPFFLFLLAPGSSALTAPVVNLISAIIYYFVSSADIAMISTANVLLSVLFAFVRAAVAYFIVRLVFKKILANSLNG